LDKVQTFVLLAPVLLFAMVAHEYAHGYAAFKQGDTTAYQLGRLTWNPIKHIDPFMTVLLPTMLYFLGGVVFGGAKPVPVNPRNYRHYKRGDIIVSLAGVATNIVIAIVSVPLVVLVGMLGAAIPGLVRPLAVLQIMLIQGIFINRILAALNLMPIPPSTDRMCSSLLPPSWAIAYRRQRGAAVAVCRAVLWTAVGELCSRSYFLQALADRLYDAHLLPNPSARDRTFLPRQRQRQPAFVVELVIHGAVDLLGLIRDLRWISTISRLRASPSSSGAYRTLAFDEAAEYLEMAARLIRIKAQMLLPRKEGVDAWEDPRAELVRRLLEYQQMREWSSAGAPGRSTSFSRRLQAADIMPISAPLALTLNDLLAAVDRVLRTAKEPVLHDVVPRSLDVAGAMSTIRIVLSMRRDARWSDMIGRDAEPWQILSVLLALLEMAKLGELRIAQSRPFGSVEICRDAVSEAA
jgi:segregation and condensation protein A